jgi:SAM-dependent methyltransferase
MKLGTGLFHHWGGELRFFGSSGINPFVERFLQSQAERFAGKTVVDVPAGSGQMSRVLRSLGATVEALDLFPECFSAEGLTCRKADLSKAIPLESGSADFVLSQEGIEHVPNQVSMFREFNRILKKGGGLLITTPNYSNLRIKLGHLLSESEYAFKRMPPNELDSIWGRGETASGEIYFGHVFPVGIQKLRFIARMAGFKIKEVHHTRVNGSSLALMFLFYPVILIVNWLAYRRALAKRKDVPMEERKRVYGEIFRYSIDPRVLVDGYLFMEFEKERDVSEEMSNLITRGG